MVKGFNSQVASGLSNSVRNECQINVSTETDNIIFLYNNFAPRHYLGVLIHKDTFATGSIMQTTVAHIRHHHMIHRYAGVSAVFKK